MTLNINLRKLKLGKIKQKKVEEVEMRCLDLVADACAVLVPGGSSFLIAIESEVKGCDGLICRIGLDGKQRGCHHRMIN